MQSGQRYVRLLVKQIHALNDSWTTWKERETKQRIIVLRWQEEISHFRTTAKEASEEHESTKKRIYEETQALREKEDRNKRDRIGIDTDFRNLRDMDWEIERQAVKVEEKESALQQRLQKLEDENRALDQNTTGSTRIQKLYAEGKTYRQRAEQQRPQSQVRQLELRVQQLQAQLLQEQAQRQAQQQTAPAMVGSTSSVNKVNGGPPQPPLSRRQKFNSRLVALEWKITGKNGQPPIESQSEKRQRGVLRRHEGPGKAVRTSQKNPETGSSSMSGQQTRRLTKRVPEDLLVQR